MAVYPDKSRVVPEGAYTASTVAALQDVTEDSIRQQLKLKNLSPWESFRQRSRGTINDIFKSIANAFAGILDDDGNEWLTMIRDKQLRQQIDALENSDAVTAVTHDHPEGMKGARAIAAAVFLARGGASMEEIRTAVRDGNSWYYLKVAGYDPYFAISASEEEEVVILNVGDTVELLPGRACQGGRGLHDLDANGRDIFAIYLVDHVGIVAELIVQVGFAAFLHVVSSALPSFSFMKKDVSWSVPKLWRWMPSHS